MDVEEAHQSKRGVAYVKMYKGLEGRPTAGVR